MLELRKRLPVMCVACSLLLLCFTFCQITKQFVRLKQVRLQRCKWKISDVRRHVIERSKDPREDRKVLEEKLAEDRDPAQLGLIDAGKRLDLEEAPAEDGIEVVPVDVLVCARNERCERRVREMNGASVVFSFSAMTYGDFPHISRRYSPFP